MQRQEGIFCLNTEYFGAGDCFVFQTICLSLVLIVNNRHSNAVPVPGIRLPPVFAVQLIIERIEHKQRKNLPAYNDLQREMQQ
jgi:hypothetical protein